MVLTIHMSLNTLLAVRITPLTSHVTRISRVSPLTILPPMIFKSVQTFYQYLPSRGPSSFTIIIISQRLIDPQTTGPAAEATTDGAEATIGEIAVMKGVVEVMKGTMKVITGVAEVMTGEVE